MLTELGKFIRKLRIDQGVLLGEMAKKLSLSSAYLSAVENGKKNATEALLVSVSKYFSLTPSQDKELRRAAADSPASVKLDLKDAANDERKLVSAFARQVSDLSSDQKSDILDMLNNSKRKE